MNRLSNYLHRQRGRHRVFPYAYRQGLLLLAFATAFIIPLASQGQVVAPTLPPGKSGHSVFVEPGWIGGQTGYRMFRVTVEVNPAVPVARAQGMTVELDFRGNQRTFAQSRLTIEAGKTSGTVEIYVPNQHSDYYWTQVRINSDSRGEIFRTHVNTSTVRNQQALLEPSMLVVDSAFSAPPTEVRACYGRKVTGQINSALGGRPKLPSLHVGLQAYEIPGSSPTPANDAFAAINARSNAHGCRPVDLPNHWIGLSGIDFIFVSLADLRKIAQSETHQTVLRKWVAAGGTLVVRGVKKFQNADKIFPLLIGTEKAELLNEPFDKWRAPGPDLRKLNRLIVDSRESSYLSPHNVDTTTMIDVHDHQFGTGPRDELGTLRIEPIQLSKTEKVDVPLILQRFAGGRVVVTDSTMVKWKLKNWRLLFNTVWRDGDTLQKQIGPDNNQHAARRFWIPGVGDPPVRAFQILVTIFMVVAGPVMLLLLRRTRRMQLLFVAVPLLSLFTCCGLFVYALLSDGLVTLGRSQTLTTIDNRTGNAVTQARASYYSGFQPPACNLGYDAFAMQPRLNRSPAIKISQLEDEWFYSGGRIRPRSPHQIVSVRSYETTCGLRNITTSKPDADKPSPPRLKNNLGFDAQAILVRTDTGLFLATDSKQSQTLALVPLYDSEDAKPVRNLVQELSPQVRISSHQDRDRQWQNQNGYHSSGKLLGDCDRLVDQLRGANVDKLKELIPAGSWLAIADVCPLTEPQLNDIKFSQQLHLIRGTWKR